MLIRIKNLPKFASRADVASVLSSIGGTPVPCVLPRRGSAEHSGERCSSAEPASRFSELFIEPWTMMRRASASYWLARYPSVGDAEDASRALSGAQLTGKRIAADALTPEPAKRKLRHPVVDVEKVAPHANVIALSNAPEDTSVSEIRDIFSGLSLEPAPVAFGDPRTLNTVQICVHFRSHQEALRALRVCRGTTIRGHRLRMRLVE